MSAEENKALARQLLEEVINKGNMAAVDAYFAPNYVEHDVPPGVPPTREGLKMLFTAFRAAFPDLHYTLEDELAAGDKVVHRIMGHGTMKGDFQGIKATGKHGMWQEMHIARFEGGKVVEHWQVVDQLGMLVSLGVMPPPGGG